MKKLIFVLALLPTIAFAQAPDPDFLNKAVSALQQQRNNALDAHAAAEAKLAIANEALAKANAKIKELEDKLDPKEKKK